MTDWRRRAEALEQEVRDLTAAVSHDLRAPLRAVDGFGRALLEHAGAVLDDQGQHYLRLIRENAARMGLQIAALTRLARVSVGELRAARVDVTALARGVIAELREPEPDRTVDVQIAEGLSTTGDPTMLRVLLETLLSNAWRFTRPRPGALIELGRRQDGPRTLYFVRDTGVGFDMAHADRLFQPFARLHSPSPNDGLGVGLALARRIVARHGGSIWGHAAPGEGATFTFTLDEDRASGDTAEP